METARKALLERRTAVVGLWKGELGDANELVSGREADWEDLAALQRDAGMVDHVAEGNVRELRGIVAALERIEDGTYGECARCGEDIEWRRLQAVWWAEHCATCAQLIEDNVKKSGEPTG